MYMHEYMQEDHQKISSCEVLNKCVRYPIIKDLKYFELLRYGSYKSLWFRADKLISNFKLMVSY